MLPPMSTKTQSIAGRFLAGIGVAVVLFDVGLRVFAFLHRREYELDHNIIVIGVILGFVGFWMIDSKKTKEALDAAGEFVPRFGRRKTDAVAVPETISTIVPQPTGEHKSIKTEIKTEVEKK